MLATSGRGLLFAGLPVETLRIGVTVLIGGRGIYIFLVLIRTFELPRGSP